MPKFRALMCAEINLIIKYPNNCDLTLVLFINKLQVVWSKVLQRLHGQQKYIILYKQSKKDSCYTLDLDFK